MQDSAKFTSGAVVFAYMVADPERYGVFEFASDGRPLRIIEKPTHAPSNYAVTGLYFYDSRVCAIAAGLRPSLRGELEITDVNNAYLQSGDLQVVRFGRGIAWLDTGTPESLLRAAEFVETMEKRQGFKIAAPEEVAWRLGYIDDLRLARCADKLAKSAYGQYLRRLLVEKEQELRFAVGHAGDTFPSLTRLDARKIIPGSPPAGPGDALAQNHHADPGASAVERLARRLFRRRGSARSSLPQGRRGRRENDRHHRRQGCARLRRQHRLRQARQRAHRQRGPDRRFSATSCSPTPPVSASRCPDPWYA